MDFYYYLDKKLNYLSYCKLTSSTILCTSPTIVDLLPHLFSPLPLLLSLLSTIFWYHEKFFIIFEVSTQILLSKFTPFLLSAYSGKLLFFKYTLHFVIDIIFHWFTHVYFFTALWRTLIKILNLYSVWYRESFNDMEQINRLIKYFYSE